MKPKKIICIDSDLWIFLSRDKIERKDKSISDVIKRLIDFDVITIKEKAKKEALVKAIKKRL